MVLSGGRNCNEINKTVHGVKRGADLMLWLNDDGMAEHWTMYSLSYWHNTLWMNASMVDWHNCTRRGPNCFSPGLNTSCRTETSAYTSLHIDGNAGNAGWVNYDMHGIPFAMRFVLETQTKTDTRTVPAGAQHALRGAAAAVAPAAPGPGASVGPVVKPRPPPGVYCLVGLSGSASGNLTLSRNGTLDFTMSAGDGQLLARCEHERYYAFNDEKSLSLRIVVDPGDCMRRAWGHCGMFYATEPSRRIVILSEGGRQDYVWQHNFSACA